MIKLNDRCIFVIIVGKIPKNQVSQEQVQSFMDQERNKRRELLQKFLNACSSSKVHKPPMYHFKGTCLCFWVNLFNLNNNKKKLMIKQVKVDTILIESEMVSKAILDLIPIVNIRKLVLGTTKSSLRYNHKCVKGKSN